MIAWELTVEATASRLHDVGFGLLMAGLLGLWMGVANVIARRFAIRRFGALGTKRGIWARKGFFFMPDWLSFLICVVAGLLLLTGAVVLGISAMRS